jgi:hypothetical protein
VKKQKKTKQMARSGETDRHAGHLPCAAVVVVYLFVSKWLGLGYALFNYPSLWVWVSGSGEVWPCLCPVIKK